MANYEQPTKDQIALKLANGSQGNPPQWQGFIDWVSEQLDLAHSHGYEEGFQDGKDDEDEGDGTDG